MSTELQERRNKVTTGYTKDDLARRASAARGT